MYARISTFHVKPDQLAPFATAIAIAADQLKRVPGITECKCAVDAEGRGVVFALYPSPEAAAAASDAIRAVWGGLMGHLAGSPTVGGYAQVTDLLA